MKTLSEESYPQALVYYVMADFEEMRRMFDGIYKVDSALLPPAYEPITDDMPQPQHTDTPRVSDGE